MYGSLGGENISQVIGRPEQEELLVYDAHSWMVPAPIPMPLLQSADPHVRRFLLSASIKSKESDVPSVPMVTPLTRRTDSAITLFVRRGNYANPCMALITMYNVYVCLEHYYGWFSMPLSRRPTLTILWLDGHAHGDLDVVWEVLFGATPLHIRQLSTMLESSSATANHHNISWVELPNAMVVNTMSVMGNEGMSQHQWMDEDETEASCCMQNSTLVAFRDFVLQQYNLSRQSAPDSLSENPKLTLLARKKYYMAHPRSNGETDRTLFDVQDDVAYLKSQYPSHTVEVVYFEGMTFQQQLEHIVSTDILVSVHGAGNIHLLFLPANATLVEYVPKNFQLRLRFRYLAECLNLRYMSKTANIRTRASKHIQLGQEQKESIQVQLRPIHA
eukprot:Nitzschia sp. Nitz4//scaffold28_size193895//119655//120818//NITZ4_001668-RA/size193895-processed-gene-0.28-mRNA-1//1//CDS//3329545991//8504//frame0